MKTKYPKINLKHLSVPTLVLLLIFTILKFTKPDLYNQITENPPPPQENLNQNIATNNISVNQCSERITCSAKVTKVIDGDTIEISTGEKVRYIGMDTPETKHPIKGVECFGKEASRKNKELTMEKDIRLEKDVSDKDKYGRLLRYVYLNSDNLFVNDFLARNGFAHAATFPPDVKFSKQFVEAEREARENQRGLWAPGICP